MKDIVILGGARDYHVMDWYRTIKSIATNRKITFLTDLIGGEGFDILIKESDSIENLFIIDAFLLKKQNRIGDIWRNIFKLLVLPLQVVLLRKYNKKNPNTIYHAQPMYYMFLCWLAGVKFIGTPQGSEILVRPKRSKLYRYFASQTLKAAHHITVDSKSMQDAIYALSQKKAILIQNGINIKELLRYKNNNADKTTICSIRGMTSLYQIDKIVQARNTSDATKLLTFIYPFHDEIYKKEVGITYQDQDLGRLKKDEMYRLLSSSLLVISIPKSDSSPRSVYESIFLGACVAVTKNDYIDALPKCMRERIFIVDLDDINWFNKALSYAEQIVQEEYIPSNQALEMFDQDITMKRAIKLLY